MMIWILVVAAILTGLALVLPRKSQSLDQQFLEAAGQHDYQAKPLLNRSEARIYQRLLDALPGHLLVHVQVSLGEILRCPDRMAFRAINSKRCDFVITDLAYTPLAVIEFQGSGHYQRNAETRDSIKRTALQSAGIDWIELFSTDERHVLEVLSAHGLTDTT